MTGLKRRGQERGEVPLQTTWGHWWYKESPSVDSTCSKGPLSPFTTGRGYITVHSLTHP